MAGLGALRDWLGSEGVTHAAMESTGVYRRPVYTVLDPRFELMLVNARHVKHLPGRKTDVRDCEWLAQLLEHGLLRGSFIPPGPVRDLRDLTRRRKALSRDRAKEITRVAKTLEPANVKLGSVVSDIMGATGRAILRAMIEGEEDPRVLAGLARGSLRRKRGELAEAVPGLIRGPSPVSAPGAARDDRPSVGAHRQAGRPDQGGDAPFLGGPRAPRERARRGEALGRSRSRGDRR